MRDHAAWGSYEYSCLQCSLLALSDFHEPQNCLLSTLFFQAGEVAQWLGEHTVTAKDRV